MLPLAFFFFFFFNDTATTEIYTLSLHDALPICYMLGDLGVRLDEAQSLVERALKEEPYNGGYLDSLGWIYFKENRTADAEAMLRKALARERHDPTIHAHLGDVYAKLGRPDLAAAEWEKSLAEWHRSLPAELETDKVAELEKKPSQSKHRVGQKYSASDAKQIGKAPA